MTDEERKTLEEGIDDAYDDFVAHVAEGRDLSESEIKNDLGALIFGEEQALTRGLVDTIGTREEAWSAWPSWPAPTVPTGGSTDRCPANPASSICWPALQPTRENRRRGSTCRRSARARPHCWPTTAIRPGSALHCWPRRPIRALSIRGRRSDRNRRRL